MENDVTIKSIFFILLKKIKLIFIVSLFMQLLLLIYLLLQPNEFENKVIIKLESQNPDKFDSSDLISISGIDIGSQDTFTSEVLETAKSLDFFEYFIEKRNIAPQIIAAVPSGKDDWLIDENIYDIKSNKWIRDVSFPYSIIPTVKELHEVFFKEHLRIDLDPKTDFIIVRTKHFSPQLIFDWSNYFISDLMEYLREKELKTSKVLLDYYFKEISNSSKYIVNESLPKIIEDKIVNEILAKALPNYKFYFIQKPYKPEFNNNNRFLNFIFFSIFIYILVSAFIFFITINQNEKNQ